MEIMLECLTTVRHEREFRANICADGFNSEWKFSGDTKYGMTTLDSFIPDEISTWYVVFRTGKHDGPDKTSWPLISVFCDLRRGERRLITLTFSCNAYHVQINADHSFNSGVCIQELSLSR